jgi:penicillin-binding protein 2
MTEPSLNFADVNERQGAFHRRTFVLGGLMGAGLTVLGARLAQLQLLQSEQYKTLSAENQFNLRIITPPRGRILDRNGVELAASRPNFRVLVDKAEKEKFLHTLNQVAELLPETATRQKQFLRDLNNGPDFIPVQVANDLTWDEFARVNVRAPELPGVTADMNEARVYPHGGAFAHVIGYVAKVSDKDVQKAREGGEVDPILLHPGFRIGKQGVEKALDAELRGTPGGQSVEVDARGQPIRINTEGSVEPKPGKDVVLTLDADVQMRAIEVFGEESGAAVLMDIRNGDILCMSSAPSFDPNKFVSGVPGREYKLLNEYERKPLLDKAITGTYAPGSTFKMVTGLAGLRHGVDPKFRTHCSGAFFFGRTFRCHGRHGSQDLHEALRNSCDVYFYTIALRIGPDAIAEVAHELGFGETFDIGIDGQKKGIVPSTAWKREYFKDHPHPDMRKWWPGETPSYAIGQGALSVNALQLAVYNRAPGQWPQEAGAAADQVRRRRRAPQRGRGAGSALSQGAPGPGAGGHGRRHRRRRNGLPQQPARAGAAQDGRQDRDGPGAQLRLGAAQEQHLATEGPWTVRRLRPPRQPALRHQRHRPARGRRRHERGAAGARDHEGGLAQGPRDAAPDHRAPGRPHPGGQPVSSVSINRPGEGRGLGKLTQIDWGLVGLLCLIAGVGGVMLYSVGGTSMTPWAGNHILRFTVFLG